MRRKKVQAARISDLLEAAQEYSTRYIDNAQVTLLGIVSSMKKENYEERCNDGLSLGGGYVWGD